MTEQNEDRSVHIYEEQKIPKRDPQDRKKDEEKRKHAEETKELFRQLKLKEARILENLGAGTVSRESGTARAAREARDESARRDERDRMRRNWRGRGLDTVWKGSPDRL
ncbi:MAG: hypothetical protein ACI4LM_05565, partial [Anaerovoracaceae bacterium]